MENLDAVGPLPGQTPAVSGFAARLGFTPEKRGTLLGVGLARQEKCQCDFMKRRQRAIYFDHHVRAGEERLRVFRPDRPVAS